MYYFFVLLISYSTCFYTLGKTEYWFIFTRLCSTINALQCLLFLITQSMLETDNLWDFYYVADNQWYLYRFSQYLFLDGIFGLLNGNKEEHKVLRIMSIIHHFIGGLGIFLMAYQKLAFFLGLYFAMTEFSTLFLNLYWYQHEKKYFVMFYGAFFCCRILTIPLLFSYLSHNHNNILQLGMINYFLAYYATYLLILLNSTWFLGMTYKLFTM